MRKLTLSLAVMAALLPGQVVPLGLGEIELSSALNQELAAEIEVLSAAPEDAEQLIVKLASREAFARAGIDRPFSLQDIKFKTVVKGEKPYIQVYTVDPVREPFLSFLVEIDWPNGHLLREYTLLLDPPVFNPGEEAAAENGGDDQAFFEPAGVSAEPAATDMAEAPLDAALDGEAASEEVVVADAGDEAAQPAQDSAQGFESAAAAPAATEEMPVLQQQDTAQDSRPAPQYTQQVSGQYRVQQTDTLWSLAEKLRPNADVSVEQMMLALVQENPESFIKENINGIKRGYILRMPDPANISAVDRQTALTQVREHNALWREYRQSMSASVPASAMEAEAADAAAHAAEPTDGRLNIVSAGGSQGSEAAHAGQDPKSQVSQLKRELSLARETLESERLEKENLSERLAELEQRVQRVLEMDDTELAKLQADLAGTKKQAEKITKPAPGLPAVAPAPVAPVKKVPAAAAGQAAGEQPLFADELAAEQSATPEESLPAEPVADDEQAPAEPSPMVQQQPKGMFANPLILAIIGGAVVLAGGLGAFLLRRRTAKAADDNVKWDMDQQINFDEAVEAVGEPYVKSRKVDATAEMHAIDIAPRSAAPVAMSDTVIGLPDEAPVEETEARDDVLAEADVYLAYGIYQQAEELLRNALRQHPERDDYRMKLLETHFASKNAAAFAELADEARQRKGSVKSYWDRVLVMGRELCPDNALFSASAALLPGFDAGDLLPHKPQTTDFELDAGGMAPDLDIGFTETPAKPSKTATADMDFSLDTESTTILRKPVVMAAPEPEFDLAADLENIANAMGQSARTKPVAAPKDDLAADLDLGGLDFSADALGLETSMATSENGLDDDFALDFEASDLGLATDDTATGNMDTSLDMDMGELSLDDDNTSDMNSLGIDMTAMDDDFDISQLADDVDEVSTKLDLARAYMDMGDNEGARNILEEVKVEGNAAQKKQAADLLAKAG